MKVKLTEDKLKQIVAESVKKVLKEEFQIDLTNNNNEGWNNANKWRAAANELQTKGSVIINIPLDYDNFLQANLIKTQRGGIYLETEGLRKEYASISDAFKALQDYANKQIVAESVKKVLLKEDPTCWYGDTKPFETIYQMADKIVASLEAKFTPEYYEEWPDDFSYEDMYEWAKKVRDDAGEYINYNSRFISTALRRIEN